MPGIRPDIPLPLAMLFRSKLTSCTNFRDASHDALGRALGSDSGSEARGDEKVDVAAGKV